MLEKGKISALQMGMITYATIIASGALLPNITAKAADRDMWLSPIWASLTGFLVLCIIYQLSRLYPKETLIQYSVHILGTIPGKAVGFFYLFYLLHINASLIRIYGDFLVGNFYSKTPTIVVLASMVLVSAFTVRGGVEVLGRFTQLFVPFLILMWLLIIILIIPDLEPKNMFPVMEHGIMPSIKGAPQSWFTHYALFAYIFPFLTDRKKGMKWGMISIFSAMLTLTIFNLTALFVFGGSTADRLYPLMDVSRYVSIGNFLEHVEAIVMAIWVLGAFIKISVYYYVLVLGTAQWLHLSDYRPVVFPLGFLLILFSIWSASNLQELIAAYERSLPFYYDTFHLVIPILLLLIAIIRKKKRKGKRDYTPINQ